MIKKIFHPLLNAGISPILSPHDVRYIYFLNFIALLVLGLIVGNMPLAMMYLPDTQTLLIMFGLHFIGIAAVIALNYRQRYLAARLCFSLVAGFFLSSYALILGQGSRWHFFLTVCIFLQLFMFPTDQKRWMYGMIFVFASLFAALELWFGLYPTTPTVPKQFYLLNRYNNTAGFLFCWVAMGMVAYTGITRSEKSLAEAHQRSEHLLLNILPVTIAERLKNNVTIADGVDRSTILFADLVGFTPLSEKVSPEEMMVLLNKIFSEFDDLVEKHGVEKIKTIGDGYMVATGLSEPQDDHAHRVAEMALDMMEAIESIDSESEHKLEIRIGINSGPLVAGVIGKKKFAYDVYGDSVNLAARLESHGLPGHIQVSPETYELLIDDFTFEERGSVDIKGKGPMTTYWLRGRANT